MDADVSRPVRGYFGGARVQRQRRCNRDRCRCRGAARPVSDTWELISERPGGTVSNLLVGDAEVLALTTAALHRSVDSGATWSTVTAGRLGPPLNAVAQSGASIFVGGQGGLHRSRDLGHA